MSKVNLKQAAIDTAGDAEPEVTISEDLLLEICPASVLKQFKAAKSIGARADFLYSVDKGELKKLRDAYKAMDNFVTKLEQWFIQELSDDERGVAGKVGRVEVKVKELATVEDWTAFYAHIAKKKEFDLLNKALNQKSIQARWEDNKEIPGVGKFSKKTISLTGVK
jgi:hypothetical protein